MQNTHESLQIFKNKKVLLTGHTGFKGAWLLQILHLLGANVKGYALPPKNDNDLYHQVQGDDLCYSSVMADILDFDTLKGELIRFEPDFVFHLAAQSLVKDGYANPVATFETNIMGTVHLLEALRLMPDRCVGVMITTDKVYENLEKGIPFTESDKLGGYDPYSASKAADEIVIDSYRHSFFNNINFDSHNKSIASVRAGNVIGGGDFSNNRIIPDIYRALEFEEPVALRNPNSVRPWQHVLEPLFAYLLLASKMYQSPLKYNTSYNVGPLHNDVKTVQEITQIFIDKMGRGAYVIDQKAHPHEANLLLLNNEKIKNDIGFYPKLTAQQAVEWTADWYADKSLTASEKCHQQIKNYMQLL